MTINVKRSIIAIIICLFLCNCSNVTNSSPTNNLIQEHGQVVVIKADDLRFDSENIISDKWLRFFNYIERKNLKASIGVIGKSLSIGNNSYFSYLKYLAKSNNFELWNHGYLHLLNGENDKGEKYHEFWNRSFEYQKEHLLFTQNMAKEKLGINFHGFGAPGNNIDSNTVKAIEEIPEIKVWFYGNKNSSKLVLDLGAIIEVPTGVPNYEAFVNHARIDNDVLTLQVHPNQWSQKEFDEFKRIIDYLVEKDVTFMNGYEYYQLLQKERN